MAARPRKRLRSKAVDVPSPLPDPYQAARRGISDRALKCLLKLKVPTEVLEVLACLQTLCPVAPSTKDIDCVKFFCGVKAITNAFNAAGYFAVTEPKWKPMR